MVINAQEIVGSVCKEGSIGSVKQYAKDHSYVVIFVALFVRPVVAPRVQESVKTGASTVNAVNHAASFVFLVNMDANGSANT